MLYRTVSNPHQFSHAYSVLQSLKDLVINTANLRIGALSFGNPNAPKVLALHGWLDNAASFIPLAEHLDQINLVALDFPGHGKSEHRSGANAYHFIDYAADVLLAAEALGWKNFSLLGHSLGAAVAALIAAVAPEKVKCLAMVEGLVPFTASSKEFSKQFRLHLDATLKPASPNRIYQSVEQAAIARQKVGDLSLPAAMLIVQRNLTESSEGYVWRTDRCLKWPSPAYLNDEQVSQYLGKIQCQTLLLRSSQGIVTNWPRLSGRESHLRHLKIFDIEGGHHCHMDDPKSVAKYLTPFFDGA